MKKGVFSCRFTFIKTDRHFRSGGGTSQADRERISVIEQKIELIEKSLATETKPGLVRLSQSESITDTTGLALAASEKNSAVSGTIMNRVSGINKTLSDFMDGTRVIGGYIGYKANNKETALNEADNPTIVIGKKTSPYAILFQDYVGDSPFGGGECLLFGYAYANDMYGIQIRLKFDSAYIFIRKKASGAWSGWRQI